MKHTTEFINALLLAPLASQHDPNQKTRMDKNRHHPGDHVSHIEKCRDGILSAFEAGFGHTGLVIHSINQPKRTKISLTKKIGNCTLKFIKTKPTTKLEFYLLNERNQNHTTMETKSTSSSGISHRSTGFTLTELLVVILIIAVLAALFMGISTTARRSADNVGCLNNLRGISNAMELYSQDHNGILPSGNSGPADAKPPLEMYRIVLPEYVYGENATRNSKGTITPESGGSAFSCPAARRQFGANTMTPTYGFNGDIEFQASGSDKIQNMKKINIPNPSKTMIMMDGANAWFGRTTGEHFAYWYFVAGPGGSRRPTKSDKKNDFVHAGKVNVLFVDGHIEARTPIEIPTDGENVFWKTNGTF
ncbi:MAG: prepilin-type N-terminal cleavage/methylation domain-containing protein [Akkermansiaceae bacterium]|nr:prepilin-type N-terminal cleavage/methylation domain-containing protein [Akkermansiaceae bacterium]